MAKTNVTICNVTYRTVTIAVCVTIIIRPLALINHNKAKSQWKHSSYSKSKKNKKATADRTARRQFQATGQPVSRTHASDAMTSRLPRYEARCVCNAGASNAGQSLCIQISRERSYPLPLYWYHSKSNWLHYNFAADSFYVDFCIG